MTKTIKVRIMSPVALVWEVDATAITAENSAGVFDILPDHARFLSLMNNTPFTVELVDGTKKLFTFENAMLFFEDNIAVIYIQEELREQP
jgi:F0F1-type ATP synthase epsilon subunit